MSSPSDGSVDESEEKFEPTIWMMPDDLWQVAKEILQRELRKRTKGHRRVELRPTLDGIAYRLRTGRQRNHLPKEFGTTHCSTALPRRCGSVGVRGAVGGAGHAV